MTLILNEFDLISPVKADTTSSTYQVSIGNTPPTVSSIICIFNATGNPFRFGSDMTSYAITQATNYDLLCNVTVNDTNGYQDMGDGWVNMTYFYQNVNWKSPISNDTFYINNSCRTISGTGSGNTIMYECGVNNIKYWATAGIWTVLINLSDGTDAGMPGLKNITITNVTSIWQSPTINFGSMGLGEIGDVNNNAMTNNTGNTKLKIGVQASTDPMTCTIGTIPVGNITYDLAATTWALACGKLTTSSAWGCTDDMVVNKCTGSCPAPSTNISTWGIAIPSSGVGGSCSLAVTITASQA